MSFLGKLEYFDSIIDGDKPSEFKHDLYVKYLEDGFIDSYLSLSPKKSVPITAISPVYYIQASVVSSFIRSFTKMMVNVKEEDIKPTLNMYIERIKRVETMRLLNKNKTNIYEYNKYGNFDEVIINLKHCIRDTGILLSEKVRTDYDTSETSPTSSVNGDTGSETDSETSPTRM